MKRLSIIFATLLLNFNVGAYEKSDAFIVKIFDDKVKVLSPTVDDPNLSVIIENKTLVDIRGKIETGRGEILNYVNIKSRASSSLELKRKNKEKIFFIQQSPPFQKVELKLGNRPYEIPPQT
jgi:hypothetical protein